MRSVEAPGLWDEDHPRDERDRSLSISGRFESRRVVGSERGVASPARSLHTLFDGLTTSTGSLHRWSYVLCLTTT